MNLTMQNNDRNTEQNYKLQRGLDQLQLEDQSEFALDLYYEFFLGDNRVQKDNDEDDSNPNDTDVNAEQTLKDN